MSLLCPCGLLCVISGLLAGGGPGFRSEFCCFTHKSLYGDGLFLPVSFALVHLAIPIHLMMHKTSSTQLCQPGLYATLPFCLVLVLLVCLFFVFVWFCVCLFLFLVGPSDLIWH